MTTPSTSPGPDEIRGLIAARDELIARIPWDEPDEIAKFNAVQDKLAARVPRLLAAVSAVLELADEWSQDKYKATLPLDLMRQQCAEALREAIRSSLAGDSSEKGAVDES